MGIDDLGLPNMYPKTDFTMMEPEDLDFPVFGINDFGMIIVNDPEDGSPMNDPEAG